MTDNEALHILGQAVMTASELLIPVLAVALVVGVAVSLLQAVTQVQEMTLTFVPKLAGITLVLLVMGHWMMTQLVDFTRELFLDIPHLVTG
jgi:flagellar biosynthesis protein FliQ